jgi:uncharacterized repeat protein (TIGR01451 family)
MLYSGAMLASATNNSINSFTISNSTATGNGNDVAFNLLQIMDVTPQLFKSFNPDPSASDGNYNVVPGGTATLTFTIENTTDYLAKDGWSFTDTLPGDLTVSAVGPINCGTGTVDTSGVAGNQITLSGNLAAGLANAVCTVQVVVNVPGDQAPYENGPDNITSINGLLDPNTVSLSASPLTATKSVVSVSTDQAGANPITDASGKPVATAAGEYINYQIEVQNSTLADATISSNIEDDTASGFSGVGGPVVVTCPSMTVPAASAGIPGSVTCTAQYQVQAGDMSLQPQPPATIAYINNAALVTINSGTPFSTNQVGTPVQPPKLSITKSADSTTIAVNQVINFSFDVTNTGSVPLTNVSVTDGTSTGFAADLTVSCPQTTLDPGATMTCTANPYTITQADIAAAPITNTAIATGWAQGITPTSTPVSTDGTNLPPGQAWAKGQIQLSTGVAGGVAQIPALDARALALLALLLGGLGYFAQRKLRR